MKITIVMGFFLPMPPIAGGATEKSWMGLADEFVRLGHSVTIISRRLANAPPLEMINGVRHLRLPGHAHQQGLIANIWHDLLWSLRVWRALPEAEINIVNCLALPLWLGRFSKRHGWVVTMPGRMPKGQYRFYGHVDRVLAVSHAAKMAVLAEKPSLKEATIIMGYPIRWRQLAIPRNASSEVPVTIGYVGRLHREKGLDLLVAAMGLLASRNDLPSWHALICGPADIARGGSGEAYAGELDRSLAAVLPRDRYSFVEPVFSEEHLAKIYQRIHIFCYPSLADQGETFGVAVAEAMAAGAVPIVSRLRCFNDLVREGETGFAFDHSAQNAAERLANQIAFLLLHPVERQRLAHAAQEATRIYDFPGFAERLLRDFSTLK